MLSYSRGPDGANGARIRATRWLHPGYDVLNFSKNPVKSSVT